MAKIEFDKFRTTMGETITSLKYGKLVNEETAISFEWNNSYKTGGHYKTADGEFRTLRDLMGFYNG